jgi:hypothetical protein
VITNVTENTIQKLSIFPNPANDYIQINGAGLESEEYVIYNQLGDVISEGLISTDETIDISHLTNGLYFIRLSNNQMMKFIKK